MPEFRGDGSAAFRDAVVALKRLPLDLRQEACAAAISADLREASIKQFGQPSKGKTNWKRLLGQQGSPLGDLLPGDDHIELRVKEGALTYISHPYPLALETVREMVNACDEYGLDMGISADSWYYPLSTVRVTYTKA